MHASGGKIISLKDFADIRQTLGKIVAASGGFDPIHPGHTTYIMESKRYGDTLAVIVNGDAFLRAKKGKPFQDLRTRCAIVSAVRGVDFVIPFEIENDQTVSRALAVMRPHVFTKGGDRVDAATIPEWEICKQHNIKIISGIGLAKEWSSSWFLKEWEQFLKKSA